MTYASVCDGIGAVPVMRWIGERIVMVDAIETSADAQDYKQFEGP